MVEVTVRDLWRNALRDYPLSFVFIAVMLTLILVFELARVSVGG